MAAPEQPDNSDLPPLKQHHEATNTLTVKKTVSDQRFWGPPSIRR